MPNFILSFVNEHMFSEVTFLRKSFSERFTAMRFISSIYMYVFNKGTLFCERFSTKFTFKRFISRMNQLVASDNAFR